MREKDYGRIAETMFHQFHKEEGHPFGGIVGRVLNEMDEVMEENDEHAIQILDTLQSISEAFLEQETIENLKEERTKYR